MERVVLLAIPKYYIQKNFSDNFKDEINKEKSLIILRKL